MRDIKRRIKSVNSTKQITKAMELVSSAKLKRARENVEKAKSYFYTVRETVQDILSSLPPTTRHPYLEKRKDKKSCYIIIAADRGLCGGYNANIIRLAANSIQNKEDADIIVIGQKSLDYFKKRNYNIVGEYVGVSESPTYFDAKRIANNVFDLYEKGEIGEVYLAYTQFISTISYQPEVFRLLPVERVENQNEKIQDETSIDDFEYIDYQPSPESLLEYLIPKYIESMVFGGLVEASASEQGSRRVAMENATDSAEEMISDLTLRYNRARQAAITQEIAEIVGGAEALK